MDIGSCLARYTTELQALSGAAAALVAEFAVFGLVVAVWYARYKRELAKAARESVKDQIEATPAQFFSRMGPHPTPFLACLPDTVDPRGPKGK